MFRGILRKTAFKTNMSLLQQKLILDAKRDASESLRLPVCNVSCYKILFLTTYLYLTYVTIK